VVSGISGTTMTLSMTASYSATLTGLTIPATWTKLWWTLKYSDDDTDAEAILQVVVSNPAVGTTDGVLYVAATSATAPQRTLGGVTVTQAAGTVAITLDETLTAVLNAGSGLMWDVKCRESGGAVTILTSGPASVSHAVTWATA
jgi:hypothetical protein